MNTPWGYPETLVAEFDHWLVLFRPAQPTLGSLVLAAKGDATAFGDLEDANSLHHGGHDSPRTMSLAIDGSFRYCLPSSRGFLKEPARPFKDASWRS